MIVIIKNNVGAYGHTPLPEQPIKSPSLNLGACIRGYKSSVTNKIKRLSPEIKHIWQRNYWEHIIRNETELYMIENYIESNIANWDKDKLNH